MFEKVLFDNASMEEKDALSTIIIGNDPRRIKAFAQSLVPRHLHKPQVGGLAIANMRDQATTPFVFINGKLHQPKQTDITTTHHH